MMDRNSITKKMVTFLEKKVNCENVMNFADNYKKTSESLEQLNINNTLVSFIILDYDDTQEQTYVSKTNKSQKEINQIFKMFDFITEVNHTSLECFPYLYGVLNCHNNENSKVYIFYEGFDGYLNDLFPNLEHPSEWYDIAFQIILINYYLEIINQYTFNRETLHCYYYKKLDKPIYKEYLIENHPFTINHKFLIVLWDLEHLKPIHSDSFLPMQSISYLMEYLDKNKDNIKVQASARITKLFKEIIDNPKNTPEILEQYYSSVKS